MIISSKHFSKQAAAFFLSMDLEYNFYVRIYFFHGKILC